MSINVSSTFVSANAVIKCQRFVSRFLFLPYYRGTEMASKQAVRRACGQVGGDPLGTPFPRRGLGSGAFRVGSPGTGTVSECGGGFPRQAELGAAGVPSLAAPRSSLLPSWKHQRAFDPCDSRYKKFSLSSAFMVLFQTQRGTRSVPDPAFPEDTHQVSTHPSVQLSFSGTSYAFSRASLSSWCWSKALSSPDAVDDLRFGFSSVRRAPAIAALTLGLGIAEPDGFVPNV